MSRFPADHHPEPTLHVSVHDVLLVQVRCAFQDLFHHALDFSHAEGNCLHDGQEVVVHVVQHKEGRPSVAVGLRTCLDRNAYSSKSLCRAV